MKNIDLTELILFENDDVAIINKPPMISSLDERDDTRINILRMARQIYPDAQLCHRLDKETSGCLIIAKNEVTYRHIAIQFEKRRVLKVYHAVINGVQNFDNIEVDLPIDRTTKGVVRIDPNGKQALTFFTSIKHFRHYTLVRCVPVTGRMHQIRIHLATQKATIVADDFYGGKNAYLSALKKDYKFGKFSDQEHPIMRRLALHAREIKLYINDTEEVHITAPYPKDFEVFVKLLERYDA
jgi:23S rRNA pseudouridine955/2504/2580 synthase